MILTEPVNFDKAKKYDNGERVRLEFSIDCCEMEIVNWLAMTNDLDAGLVGDSMK